MERSTHCLQANCIIGSLLIDGRLQDDVMALELEVGIKMALSQHHGVPQFVVWPHGVIWNSVMCEPFGSHL